MKSKIIVILIVIAAGLAGVLWWWSSIRHEPMSPHDHHQQSEDVSLYICPMHPQITSDKPGTCPICGMDLVPANELEQDAGEDHAEHEGASNNMQKNSSPTGRAKVKLTLNKQQVIGVKTQKVERKELFKSIKAPGRIAFDPELYIAQSEYLEALKQWSRVKDSPIKGVKENTKQMIRSSKIRLKVLGLSESQIQSLAQKGSQTESLLVGGNDNIVYSDVFEIDLPYIKAGQSAEISASFLQGKTLSGEVIAVDQVINPETRTAKVRIKLLESDPSIRPESYVNVTISAPLGKHIAVPLESIMDTGVDTFVFLKKADGFFEPKKVKVMLETSADAAILGEITPGDEVVVGANFLIDSESRLRSVIQGGMGSSGEHSH